MAQDLVVFARHESDPERVAMYAQQAHVVASQADKCYEACYGLDRKDHVLVALEAKTAGWEAYASIAALTGPVWVAK